MALLQFSNKNKYNNTRTRIIHNDTTSLSINPSGFGSFIAVSVFKYEYEHPLLAPSLFVDSKGDKYIVPIWKKVHPKTELKDIIWKKTKIKKDKTEKKTWKFDSSSSDSVYTVTKVDSATLKCNCPGFYRAKDRNKGCKHVQKVRTSLTK
jgi:hypothetical protein